MIVLLAMSAASAKSWCAAKVVAHEWGVAVLQPQGGLVLPTELPLWFERSGVEPTTAPRVRELPADNGVRTLPVVQFWRGDTRTGPVPVGVTVGFTLGTAAVWFPPVDALALHTPEAQLTWDALTLDATATGALGPVGGSPWVQALRDAPGALWVNRGGDSERFLFYEGRTREEPAVVATFEGGAWWVRNRSDWAVHDVWLVRDGRRGHAGSLAPGARVAVTLDAPIDATWGAEVRSGWVTAQPVLADGPWHGDDCVMQRDPAVPVTHTAGYALYPSEVDAMLGVWGPRLFGPRDHLLYREDPAALDAVMPVSLYTDMRHWLEWRRLGVVLVEDAAHGG
jgi:hypothetical protein